MWFKSWLHFLKKNPLLSLIFYVISFSMVKNVGRNSFDFIGWILDALDSFQAEKKWGGGEI